MVSEGIVCGHGPGVRGNVVNLDMKIGADSTPRDSIDLAVEVSTGMEVSRNGIRWQVCVVRIADRVVTPKRGRRVEVLIYATEQIDISAIRRAAEPATRLRQWSDRCPGVARRIVLVSVRDSVVVNNAAEAVNIVTY